MQLGNLRLTVPPNETHRSRGLSRSRTQEGRQGEALSWGLRRHDAHPEPTHFGGQVRCCWSEPAAKSRGTGEDRAQRALIKRPLGATSKQGAVCSLALAPRLSKNLLPCPHPTRRCLQGQASSLSPQARRVSPSCPHLTLLTLDSSLSPEAQPPHRRCFFPGLGPQNLALPRHSNSHSALRAERSGTVQRGVHLPPLCQTGLTLGWICTPWALSPTLLGTETLTVAPRPSVPPPAVPQAT